MLTIVSKMNEDERRVEYKFIENLPDNVEIVNEIENDFIEAYDPTYTFYFVHDFNETSRDVMIQSLIDVAEHAGYFNFEHVENNDIF